MKALLWYSLAAPGETMLKRPCVINFDILSHVF
jgi:hypothetical protein